jgi:hypothetical protein
MNATIILTSTVNVNYNIDWLYQTNKNDRLDTYLKAILQWLHNTNFYIILVENSGYIFEELAEELKLYNHRFEIISFKENEIDEAQYLINNKSKGESELFAINYAFDNSLIMQRCKPNFIIKITARYYIPELEEYLNEYDLNKYDCLTQNCRIRCEMIGSHYNNFKNIFNINVDNFRIPEASSLHIENLYKMRTDIYDNNLHCKCFEIEQTQRGGVNECYIDV